MDRSADTANGTSVVGGYEDRVGRRGVRCDAGSQEVVRQHERIETFQHEFHVRRSGAAVSNAQEAPKAFAKVQRCERDIRDMRGANFRFPCLRIGDPFLVKFQEACFVAGAHTLRRKSHFSDTFRRRMNWR